MFTKILIANRGEIACRIMETARNLGIQTVAVYSDADQYARHVRMADEEVHIGGAAAADSYLRGDVIIAAAQKTGAQAIHPGYGFLSENAEFARACAAAGIKFIGPLADSIDAMGLKDKAKDLMAKAGVPVVPGYQGEKQEADFLAGEAKRIGYPVLIKAVAGGGGKGMRLVADAKDFAEALESCQREAKASFGNPHVLIEKFIQRPRHVEMQVFGDSHGGAVHLFERDCSLQRRHQKVVEEAPAPDLPDKVRKALGDAAVKAVQALGYENAGTIEFIMDSQTHEFFFMEMNTRLQVEHPVTEMVTGLDLVEWQLRVAAGEKLPLSQDQIKCESHAFEVRLYAEDPAHDFLPQTGRVVRFFKPRGDEARLDTAVDEGDNVSIHYDPMIAKIIVHGADRAAALTVMQGALAQTGIMGLNCNLEFLTRIFAHDDFIAGKVDTGFIARHSKDLLPESYGLPLADDLALAALYVLRAGTVSQTEAQDPWAAADHWRTGGNFATELCLTDKGGMAHKLAVTKTTDGHYHMESEALGTLLVEDETPQHLAGSAIYAARVNGRLVRGFIEKTAQALGVFTGGRAVMLHLPAQLSADEAGGNGRIVAPMPGKIINVLVKAGERVAKDQTLLVMEAMKMELSIRADCDGIIEELPISANDQVADGALLVAISDETESAA